MVASRFAKKTVKKVTKKGNLANLTKGKAGKGFGKAKSKSSTAKKGKMPPALAAYRAKKKK